VRYLLLAVSSLTAGTHAGEDNYATTIPDAVGKLEIILRRVTDDALEQDFQVGDGYDGTEDESDTEGEDSEGSTDDSEDEMYEECPTSSRAKKAKLAPDDLHDIFTDWYEKKPRHTHTAAYVFI
jgi:hypothetical protein